MILMTQFYAAQAHYYDLRREAAEMRLAEGNKRRHSNGKTAKLTFWGLAWLVVAIIFVAGCSAPLSAGSEPTATAVPAVQIPEITQTYVDMSKSALAVQLDISQDQIELDSVTEPATADGTTIIKLVADGETYEYHGRNQEVLLVSDPLPAAPTPKKRSGSPQVMVDLNDAVATAVTSNIVPAVEQTGQTPYWAVFPEHVEVSFSDYAQPDSMQMPKIYVYPVADLKEANQMAADQVNSLQELLVKKPDLATINPLPFLPLFNAQAMFYAQGQYLNFANGSGIRYLTQFGQAAGPITNQELVYTFQGLTDDGAYYMAAVFPVAQANLPADMASADTSFPDGFEAYIQGVKDALATAVSGSFIPALDNLDNLVSTITIQ